MRKLVLCLFVAALAVLMPRLGRADSIVPEALTVTSGPGADYTWTYTLAEDSTDLVEAGNYFTFEDFVGVQSASAPTDWTACVGAAPTCTNGGANAYDVTFTYTGGTTITGPTIISGVFSIVDLQGPTEYDDVAYFAQDTGTALGGGPSTNSGVTYGVNVPEPGTLTLFGAGLLGFVAFTSRRKKFAES